MIRFASYFSHLLWVFLVFYCPNISWAAGPGLSAMGENHEPALAVGGRMLKLNGAGIRYWFVAKVYSVGLYSEKPIRTLDEALRADVAKRILVTMLRDVKEEEFSRNFTKALRNSARKDELAASIPGIILLGEAFSSQRLLRTGDTVAIDYSRGVGTTMLVNGRQMIQPVKEPEFYRTLLRTLVGENPIDYKLRDALLGAPEPVNNMR